MTRPELWYTQRKHNYNTEVYNVANVNQFSLSVNGQTCEYHLIYIAACWFHLECAAIIMYLFN